ncbi:MAG TPA: 4-(cytidine 5'-diphospho)-2-C-methyl-D-erythritol kinase [Dehalococcoidia bacterium]|nr:4-(cytidine 5'-diphospho)-2-C-methyl-D-erythritol kinase [Dehalococcoidia bacterium]
MILTLSAYAKVNLTLEVLSKRTDGYHEIASVLQAISLADTLTFEPANTLEFQCDVKELQTPDNLVLKAVKLLKEDTDYKEGACINLTKKIPLAAGLGSGSTDAAATLIGLNKLWGLNLAHGKLLELAAKLGSDVPFFLYGGTALAEGRGEKVTPLPPATELQMVLLKPAIEPVANKTVQLYSRLNHSHFTSGQHTERLVTHLKHGGNIESSFLYNVFEQVAFDFFPRLSDYRSRLIKAGAREVHLAGSGPTLFALVSDKSQGEAVLKNLKSEGLEAYLVHTVKEVIQ